MSHRTEQVGFPAIPLNAGMSLRLRALSPTLDTTVAGVVFAQWSVYGYDESEGPPEPDNPVEWLEIPPVGNVANIPA